MDKSFFLHFHDPSSDCGSVDADSLGEEILVHSDALSLQEMSQDVDRKLVEGVAINLNLSSLCEVFLNEIYCCIRLVFDESVRKVQSVGWSSYPPIRYLAVTDESIPPNVIAPDIFMKFKEHHVILAFPYSVGAEDVWVFSYPPSHFRVIGKVSVDCDQQRALSKQCQKWYHRAVNYSVREQASAPISDRIPMPLQALGQVGQVDLKTVPPADFLQQKQVSAII